MAILRLLRFDPLRVIGAAALALVCLAGHAAAQTRVSSPAELAQALRAARGGERIELAPGDYGVLTLVRRDGARYASPVVVASADPARPAVLSGVSLREVENLTLSGLRLSYTFSPGDKVSVRPFSISNSRKVGILDSEIVGSAARGTGTVADGFGFGVGLSVTRSEDIAIERNRFSAWHRGAVLSMLKRLVVRGNTVTDLRSDGMNFAQVSDVLIEGNHFHDFRTELKSGDHPDMIQFWTNRTTEATVNVTIRNNLLDMGGGAWTQSIFMRNEEVDHARAGREMFYRNIVVTGNLIRNAHVHGITVGQADGVTITGNTLIQALPSPRVLHVTVPGINVHAASSGVRIENNVGPRFPEAASGWVVANNVRIQRNFPRAGDFYTNVFVDGLAAGAVPLHKLKFLPGGLIPPDGVGSPLNRFDADPREPLVLIASRPVEAARNAEHRFEVAAVHGPRGRMDLAGASAAWSFEDGTRQEGLEVRHRFAGAGLYKARVLLTLKDGSRISGERTIMVE